MSTILDALKKSEAERLAGRPRADVPAAPGPRRFRRLALPAVALAGIVTGIVATALWLRPATPGAPVAAGPNRAGVELPPQAAVAATEKAAAAQKEPEPEPRAQPPARVAATPSIDADPPAQEAARPVQAPLPQPRETHPLAADRVPAAATRPAAVTPAPAQSPSRAERLAAYAQLPQLRRELGELELSMLVYSAAPERRFALINGQRLGNGARLANGAVLEEIRREGCVLSFGGRRFLLTTSP